MRITLCLPRIMRHFSATITSAGCVVYHNSLQLPQRRRRTRVPSGRALVSTAAVNVPPHFRHGGSRLLAVKRFNASGNRIVAVGRRLATC
jgi:hypothetical protein